MYCQVSTLSNFRITTMLLNLYSSEINTAFTEVQVSANYLLTATDQLLKFIGS